MRLVYTATGKPVLPGDIHTINGFELRVAHTPQPHKPDSEGKIDFYSAGGIMGPTYYCSVIGAEWIEREDRRPSATEDLWLPPLAYNEPDHVCPITGRVALTVAAAYAREDMPDRTFYLYSKEAADMGLECWRLLDGLDATVEGFQTVPHAYTLDFPSGSSLDVKPDHVIYMQRTKEERAA